MTEDILEERKKRLKEFFVKKNLWLIGVLIVALILGIYLRSLPMSDHGGRPGLWDVTTNDWTLGPDLDPFLFLRYADTIVENGSLPAIDNMRNVPLGFETGNELQMVSYMIVLTYRLVNIFGAYTINYAGVVMPVIFFALTIISFFLFVREIFYRKESEDKNLKANLVALISTFFMIVIPVFLSRTIAGIPEKESVAFFFMFFALYLFVKAWKSERIAKSLIIGVFAGIFTGLMGLTWGGMVYIYMTIAIAGFIAFILNKIHKKEFLLYSIWLIVSLITIMFFSQRFSLISFFTGLDTGLPVVVLLIFAIHFLIWKTKIKNYLPKTKIPSTIQSLIISIIIILVLVSIVFGPGFIIEKIQDLNKALFKPVTGRWNTTVAENRQPYFNEWAGNFGPYIKNMPITFWLFIIGSVVLFRQMLRNIKNKDSWILVLCYIIFLFGLIFSRYSETSILNGENFISKSLYYITALLLIGAVIYYYAKYKKEQNDSFEKIEFEYIFIFALFILCLFTARSAVRLIMTLGPIAPIFLAYLNVYVIFQNKSKDDTKRLLQWVIVLVVVFLTLFSFYNFYKEVKTQAYNYVPYYYTEQWQNAMNWTRTSTPENSVFCHWWDYGYWLQTMGNRATVTDGGNAITYWNYLTGRYVLTAPSETDALGFLYNHKSTHLLIDSSDLGKYGAFSSIGSNQDMDRFSPGPPSLSYDASEVQETKTGVIRIYKGSSYIDEDIIYNDNGTKIFMPAQQQSAIIGIILEEENSIFKQPQAVFYTQGKQITLPLRYIYFNNKIIDFKTGIEATAYVIPRVSNSAIDQVGVIMYVSPRIMRGLLGQLYILNDPFNKFSGFKLVHSEPNVFIENIEQQGYKLNEFSYIEGIGLSGPIKIWGISYKGNEQVNESYLGKDASKYIDWEL